MWIIIAIIIIGVGIYFFKGSLIGPRSGASTLSDNVADKDAWELSFKDEAVAPAQVKETINFDYIDGNKTRSSRTVDVTEFDQVYGGAIIGHCHMRDATRTFRTDRMSNCIDVKTGTPIPDINKFLLSSYNNSPQHSCDMVAEKQQDYLKVMLYIAKADGQYRKEEKEVVRDVIRTLANDNRITDETADGIMDNLSVPTLRAFQLAVGRIFKSEKSPLVDLVEVAEKIINTQQTMTAVEKEALDYIKTKKG